MKKIIVLAIILLIPFGIIFLENPKKPLLERVEKDGFSKKPKDSLWEYVKHEFDRGRINFETNYREKYKDPILITLKNATAKDSLAVNDLLKTLKDLFPLKQVGYFFDLKGKPFIEPIYDRNNPNNLNQSDDELMSYVTQISFGHMPAHGGTSSTKFNLNIALARNIKFRKNTWNRYLFNNELMFGFVYGTSIEDRKEFIIHHFFKSMWETHTLIIENPVPDFRIDQTSLLQHGIKDNVIHKNLNHLEDNKFLIKKLFSNDFQKQFDNYMYKTYPWRYASLFLNKKTAERKAMLIVVGLGLLVFILMMSAFHNKKFKYSFLNYFLPIIFLLFHLCTLYYIYLYLTDLNSFIGWDTNIVFMLMRIPPVALLTSLLLWSFDRYIVKVNMNFTIQLLSKVIFTYIVFNIPFVWVLFAGLGVSVIFHPNVQYFYYTILFVWAGLAIGRGLLLYLNHFSESLIKQKDIELSKLKELHAQAETKLLQSQINPHFLYNSLNSIASLAPIDSAKTQKMAYSLSDLFKYSINRKGKKMSTVKEEIDMVKSYLDIEKIRFGDRLQFDIKVDQTIKNHEIPLFLIQPLVENAVKHGVSKNEGKGKIILKIEKKETHLSVEVKDNGPDFPEGLVSGHGLQTVYDLLRLSYGDNAALNWTNTPEKVITITIPETI